MNEKFPTDPFELLEMSKDWLSTQQKFLPSGHIYERVAETIRTVTQAQIAYNQALTRANAALLAALLERPLETAAEDKTTTR